MNVLKFLFKSICKVLVIILMLVVLLIMVCLIVYIFAFIPVTVDLSGLSLLGG